MDAYSWIWRQLAAVYCVVGIIGAVPTLGWPSTLVLFGSTTAIGFICALTYSMVESYPFWEWVWVGTASGCFTLGAIGTLTLFGPVSLLVLALFGVTAPRTLRTLRWLIASPPSMRDIARALDPSVPEKRPTVKEVAREVPAAMSDSELCAAWRRSFLRLERARTPEARMQVVRMRESYLDEMQARHPAGFQAWLASGTRASGDPSSFLGGPVTGDPPVELG